MQLSIGIGSEAPGQPQSPSAIVAEAEAVEADGFEGAWAVNFSRGMDALTALALAGSATTRLRLGAGIVPTYPRHPAALAQQALTVGAAIGDRVTLGVGVSHRPVIEGMHGLEYVSAAAHMREYLSVLVFLLNEGSVSFDGGHYRVEMEVSVPGAGRVPVVVGGLSPGMLRVAGTHADGADAARAVAGELFGRYASLDNDQRLFEREGVGGPDELLLRELSGGTEQGGTGRASVTGTS